MCTDVVILAGGIGERLWPVSTESHPKQFIHLPDTGSLLQSALTRAWKLQVSGSIYIITRTSWISLVLQDIHDLAKRENLPDLPEKIVVMGEPFGKNTAPAAAWISRMLETLNPGGTNTLLLVASDHVIGDADTFIQDVETASRFAEQNKLVSFAIAPRFPSTGYGYITAGEPLDYSGHNGAKSFTVVSFHEKPDLNTAKRYLDTGHTYWNSGMYAFNCRFFLDELEQHSPVIAEAFTLPIEPEYRVEQGVRIMQEHCEVIASYEASPAVSIDYAVSEKCEHSVSVLARFDWDDVGSWDSLSGYLEMDGSNTAMIESDGSCVYSDIPVALCGIDDAIVVIHDGKAFISRKGKTHLIRNAIASLQQKDVL